MIQFTNNTINKITGFRYAPQLLLLLVLIVGYWDVIFFSHPLKYDIIDCTYPWKYFVGECLQNHILPMWNPYQTLGYPIHADPQVGVWYPFTWIVGYLHGYDIYSLSLEFILHIYIAGIGMYMLGRAFGLSKSVSFFMGCSYMFSGFFIGNSQHYTIIVSAAWIPYVINYYIKFSREKKYFHSVTAAFFMYLLLSGGYPAFTIILGYFLAILFLYFLLGTITKKGWLSIIKLIKLNFVFAFTLTLFSAVIIISAYTVSSYITRGADLPLYLAQLCPFSPQSLISIILPFASIKDLDFFNTDLSMTNIYFGLIAFVFFILSFFYKKPRLIIVFLLWGVFCLTAAMGSYLPVRKFLFDFIPFMGMFRFPSIFRLFTIISFVLTAGFAFHTFIENKKTQAGILKFIVVLMMSIFIVFIIWSRVHGYLTIVDFIRHDLFSVSEDSQIWQHIAFQSCLQLFFLFLLIVALWKIKNKITLRNIMIVLLIIDLVFAAKLNEPYTTYDHALSAKEVNEITYIFPKDFPAPSTDNVILHTDAGLGSGPFWRNMNIFYKQIAWDGFTSFRFKGYEYMNDSLPAVFRSTLSNPFVYLSDKIFPSDSMKVHDHYKIYNHQNIYIDDAKVFSELQNNLHHNSGDTIIIEKFSPSEIILNTRSADKQLLCFLQNYYPGWTAMVNGSPCKIETYTKGLMCVVVPAGDSKTELVYHNNKVIAAALISFISLLIYLLVIISRIRFFQAFILRINKKHLI